MSLHGLLDAVVKDTALAEAIQAAADGNRMHVDLVGPPAARPFAIAALARETDRPVLAVTATGREAEDLAAALRSLLPPTAWWSTRRGRPSRTSGSALAATPSAVGSPSSDGSPTRGRTTRRPDRSRLS